MGVAHRLWLLTSSPEGRDSKGTRDGLDPQPAGIGARLQGTHDGLDPQPAGIGVCSSLGGILWPQGVHEEILLVVRGITYRARADAAGVHSAPAHVDVGGGQVHPRGGARGGGSPSTQLWTCAVSQQVYPLRRSTGLLAVVAVQQGEDGEHALQDGRTTSRGGYVYH